MWLSVCMLDFVGNNDALQWQVGPALQWVGRAGKLLVFVAGLVILLDLLESKIANWKTRAEGRRAKANTPAGDRDQGSMRACRV